MLIREAFLRGISTRQTGRVVGILTGEVVRFADGVEADSCTGPGGVPVSSGAA